MQRPLVLLSIAVGAAAAGPQGAVVSGRLVAPDGEPAAGARVAYQPARLEPAPGLETRSDQAGRFRLELSQEQLGPARLVVRTSDGAVERVEHVDVPRAGLDLGTWILQVQREVHVLVRSSAGGPLAGAYVRWQGAGESASAETDAQGRAVLRHAPAEAGQLLVGAPRHFERQVAVGAEAAGAAAPLDVALSLEPALVVYVRFDDGSSLSGLRIRAETADPEPFVDAGGARRATAEVLDPPHLLQPELDRGLVAPVPDHGRVVLPGLRPRGALDVVVLDGAARVVARRRVLPPQLEAREPVELALPGPPKTLEVHALGPDGAPLTRFEVRTAGEDLAHGRSPVRGRATLRKLVGGSVDVVVVAEGLAPELVLGVPLPERRNELQVRLRDGLPLRVRALDAGGRPAGLHEVVVDAGHGVVRSSHLPLPDGAHLVQGLPRSPLVVHALTGARWLRREHDPRDGELVLRLPSTGTLLLGCVERPPFSIVLLRERGEGVPPQRMPVEEQVTVIRGQDEGTARLRLLLRKTGDDGPATVVRGVQDRRRGLRVDAVEPGTYVLEAQWNPDSTEEVITRSAPLEVRAGELTAVPIDTTGVRGG